MLQVGAGIVALILVGIVGTLVAGAREPERLGLTAEGTLQPCPGTPNCVASRSSASYEQIEPFRFEGSAEEAHQRLTAALAALPRTTIVRDDGTYLHATSRTPSYLFVDDLEFLIDGEAGRIDLRSASRLGRGDGGKNRDRIEQLRVLWEQRQ